MIDKQNFKALLYFLHFNFQTSSKQGTTNTSNRDSTSQATNSYEYEYEEATYFTKHFPQHNCTLEVDFTKGELIYPKEIIKESQTTSNFSQNENFVVFECVHRLLEMGYKPEDLVLEKTWTLGHSGKSGRADITIFKENEKQEKEVYCIIECKTAGKEYDQAKKDLFNNEEGKQLFSYAAQARSVEYLAIYASDFIPAENSTIKKDKTNKMPPPEHTNRRFANRKLAKHARF
ncbi:type I restriction enzyme HsdR N-terminal domain-containing protein [Helicobacter aurati]|uniref:type I restriction enzyme HsdR N-terminal domain-containing protein n=1 Tax=Helicobacter aurati TaxID=137778 RepID=UPI000CF1AD81|nr:type I restriction enzyme HsdR N-terminal domain-containing protein [Helicobacter aurati]